MSKYKVTRKRMFLPHLMLLEAARRSLAAADDATRGQWWHWLNATLHTALAIEAIGNVFGERLLDRWSDFQSAGPIAKLRLVAARLGLQPDFSVSPWMELPTVIRFRNSIAHAKLQDIVLEEVRPFSALDERVMSKPLSKIEQQITRGNAGAALQAAEKIVALFLCHMDKADADSLRADSYSGSAEPE